MEPLNYNGNCQIILWELSKKSKKKWKAPDGATENLKNAIHLVSQDDFLLVEREKFQRKMFKNHSKMKKRLIGFGGSKTTGAKGLKKMKNFKRSKSAPPGAPGGGWVTKFRRRKREKSSKKDKNQSQYSFR